VEIDCDLPVALVCGDLAKDAFVRLVQSRLFEQ